MAGGKLSPRQKMINLMYLVFIAMLALNMSKEVLSAFGSINEKLSNSNEIFEDKNELALANLKAKKSESDDFAKAAEIAENASELSTAYFNYLENEKKLLLAEVPKEDGQLDYESMDKSNYIDERYYKGGKPTAEGKKFLAEMDTYRKGMMALVGEKNPALASQIKDDFSTDPIVDGEGVKKDYISYHFVGFPSVASLTKMTQLQNDIKVRENELLSKLLSGGLTQLASYDNYTTLLEQTKGAYYSGEKFDGRIVLGRKDEATTPSRVELTIDGRKLSKDQYSTESGKLVLNVNAGNVGDHKIAGSLFYAQDGEEIEVPVEQSFTTIDRPNTATIAADKMNVVYRGVTNPMTISFAGMPDNTVKASAPGLSRIKGTSYAMRPGTGREVTINVTGTLPDGGNVTDKKTFRIKDIPRPTGTIRGQDGEVKMQKEALATSPIGAALPDFDFDLNLDVTSFKFRVEGAATVQVNGGRLNAQAKNVLKRARRGSVAQIFDIKANIKGNSGYRLKKVSPVFIELTN